MVKDNARLVFSVSASVRLLTRHADKYDLDIPTY